jgi:hypothetical protein
MAHRRRLAGPPALALLLSLALAGAPRTVLGADPRSAVALPSDEETALKLDARGTQNYECRAKSDGSSEWVLVAPEADLFDASGKKMGRHYAGPTWESADGSKITGTMRTRAAAPERDAIPWLLLTATPSAGDGVLAHVKSVQRTDTRGGTPPAGTCSAGQTVKVPYAAVYTFSRAKVASAQPGAAQAQLHVRGDVVAVHGNTLEVRSTTGEPIKLELAPNATVASLEKSSLDAIRSGDFIGTTAAPQQDGTLRAMEVHVFAESLRGTGEGHHPWDLQPGSTMTNATVAQVGEAGGAQAGGTGSTMTNATVTHVDESGGGRKLLLRYADGEKTVVVPPGTPVVRVEKSDRSQLQPGTHLFAIVTRQPDGTLVAQRLNVGKGGVVPPM